MKKQYTRQEKIAYYQQKIDRLNKQPDDSPEAQNWNSNLRVDILLERIKRLEKDFEDYKKGMHESLSELSNIVFKV